jgi:hypothetical protein
MRKAVSAGAFIVAALVVLAFAVTFCTGIGHAPPTSH